MDPGRQLPISNKKTGRVRNMIHAGSSASRLLACGLLFLAGCGGGGGSGGSGGTPGGSNEATLSVSPSSLTVAANYGDPAPTRTVRLSVKNPPDQLYAGASVSGEAVAQMDIVGVSATAADLVLYLRPPVDLPVGQTLATVTVRVCPDEQCSRELRGSPATITVSYSIASPSVVSLAGGTVVVAGSLQDTAAPIATAVVNVSSPPAGAVTFALAGSSANIQSVTNLSGVAGAATLQLTFRHPDSVGIGVHNEDVAVRACYDSNCMREIPGSPLIVRTSYTVTGARPEIGVTPLAYLSRQMLAHDVVDAEYVDALDAIVMVSSAPVNALYLYDVATGTERQLTLNRAPTAVSVSPDGQFVAVGHDALITHVDLAALVAGTPSTKLLNVSTRVFDLALDGRGIVHALPAADQWVDIHSVNVATNTETTTWGQLYAGSHGRLHPSGDYLYTANNGLSPSDIAKYDVRSGVALLLYDSPYHGQYEMCGDLWFKEDGATVYTKCGNAFRTSTLQAQDMVYSGRLQLYTSQFNSFRIDALSQSDATREIVLLESDWYECAPDRWNARCYTHLAVYESDFLNRTGVYSLAPIEVAGSSYGQRGLFVFHSRDGLHRYLVSRLDPAPNATQSHFVTVLQ
jgi:hypothetical protein